MPTKSKEELAAQQADLEREVGKDVVRSEAKQYNTVSVRNLADVASIGYDDMEAYLAAQGIDVEEATPETVAELAGDGFVKIEKARLVNVPHIILTWSLDSGNARMRSDDGEEHGFYIVRAVTQAGDKVWYTVGGEYGLSQELTALAERRREQGSKTPNAGYKLPKGLKADPLPDYPGKFIFRSAV